jgi:hypothetical protein
LLSHAANVVARISRKEEDMIESKANLIIELFKEVQKRPYSYLGPIGQGNIPAVRHFIDGIHAACRALNVHNDEGDRKFFEEVVIERGWEYGPSGLWEEMRERGLSEEAIVQELLAIELEVWKRNFHIHDS